MSYIKTKEMIGPISDDLQVISVGAGDASVTLETSRAICNATSVGGIIFFTPSDGSTMVSEYFPAGFWKPISASSIGGTVTGTTVTKVHIWP